MTSNLSLFWSFKTSTLLNSTGQSFYKLHLSSGLLMFSHYQTEVTHFRQGLGDAVPFSLPHVEAHATDVAYHWCFSLDHLAEVAWSPGLFHCEVNGFPWAINLSGEILRKYASIPFLFKLLHTLASASESCLQQLLLLCLPNHDVQFLSFLPHLSLEFSIRRKYVCMYVFIRISRDSWKFILFCGLHFNTVIIFGSICSSFHYW